MTQVGCHAFPTEADVSISQICTMRDPLCSQDSCPDSSFSDKNSMRSMANNLQGVQIQVVSQIPRLYAQDISYLDFRYSFKIVGEFFTPSSV